MSKAEQIKKKYWDAGNKGEIIATKVDMFLEYKDDAAWLCENNCRLNIRGEELIAIELYYILKTRKKGSGFTEEPITIVLDGEPNKWIPSSIWTELKYSFELVYGNEDIKDKETYFYFKCAMPIIDSLLVVCDGDDKHFFATRKSMLINLNNTIFKWSYCPAISKILHIHTLRRDTEKVINLAAKLVEQLENTLEKKEKAFLELEKKKNWLEANQVITYEKPGKVREVFVEVPSDRKLILAKEHLEAENRKLKSEIEELQTAAVSVVAFRNTKRDKKKLKKQMQKQGFRLVA